MAMSNSKAHCQSPPGRKPDRAAVTTAHALIPFIGAPFRSVLSWNANRPA
jgi:hypothetical protein